MARRDASAVRVTDRDLAAVRAATPRSIKLSTSARAARHRLRLRKNIVCTHVCYSMASGQNYACIERTSGPSPCTLDSLLSGNGEQVSAANKPNEANEEERTRGEARTIQGFKICT
jgi:hypothetical protein